MKRRRRMFACALLVLSGCTAPPPSASQSSVLAPTSRLRDVFPSGGMATPWRLAAPAWDGQLQAAIPALEDAPKWRALAPHTVGLARYVHEADAQRVLVARVFAFDQPEAARNAYRTTCRADAEPLEAGDEGCWTSVGVCVRRAKLLIEVFGQESSWESQVQSAFLLGLIERRMNATGAGQTR